MRSFGVGTIQIGALELELAAETEPSCGWFHLRVRNTGAAPLWLGTLAIGFRWKDPSGGTLRYLRHGWQSWSPSGAQTLDAGGSPACPSGPWLR